MRAAIAVGIACLLLAGCRESGGPEHREPPVPVPHPVLDSSPASVRDQISRARAALDSALEGGHPGQALGRAFGELGMLYQAYDLREAALACYRNAELADPDTFSWVYYQGHLERRAGRPQRAVERFTRALEIRPGHLPATIELGRAYYDLNDFDRAQRTFERAQAVAPDLAAVHLELGRVALGRGDYANAVEMLERARSLEPQATEIHYALGLAYRGLGRDEEATRFLEQGGSARSTVPDPDLDAVFAMAQGSQNYLNRGVALFREGRHREARDAFREAVRFAPDNAAARTNLGLTLIRLGELEDAQQALEEAVRLDPRDANAHYNLGTLYANQGLDERAIAEFTAALDVNPDLLQAHFNLGNALRREGRFLESVPHYRVVVERDGSHSQARLAEALALIRLHRYADARQRLEEAHRALPQDIELRHALVRVLAAAPDDSVRDGKRAMQLGRALAEGQVSFQHMVTLAMVAAENGLFSQAIQAQKAAVDTARKAGRRELVQELEINLARYRQGQACREPWPDDDPMLSARAADR